MGSNLGHLPWEHEVLATGPPGKPHSPLDIQVSPSTWMWDVPSDLFLMNRIWQKWWDVTSKIKLQKDWLLSCLSCWGSQLPGLSCPMEESIWKLMLLQESFRMRLQLKPGLLCSLVRSLKPKPSTNLFPDSWHSNYEIINVCCFKHLNLGVILIFSNN